LREFIPASRFNTEGIRLMKLFSSLILSLLTISLSFGQADSTAVLKYAGQHIYAGVERCQVCHEADDIGNQFGAWQASNHAKAYQTLLSEEAAKIAKEKGLKKPAYESPECLECHVTGYSDPKAEYGEKYKKEDGIGCESCHGAGEFFRKADIMCDIEMAKANGLIIPKEEDCLRCHNERSPRYKPFDFKTYDEKIAHKLNPEYKCENAEEEDEDW